MNKETHEVLARLCDVLRRHHPKTGPRHPIEDDAQALRRISMTLHRWHELECGDGNEHASWCITRGKQTRVRDEATSKALKRFEHDEAGKPFLERHSQHWNSPTYAPIADREAGVLKRLAKIMARYPSLTSYVQTDPRGAALYILRPGDVPEGADVSSYYSRGVAVFK